MQKKNNPRKGTGKNKGSCLAFTKKTASLLSVVISQLQM